MDFLVYVYEANNLSLVMRNPAFCICKNKDADQLCNCVTAQLISAFVFATGKVQSLFYLNPTFQAYSHLLWVYSLVCVRPGRKSRRPIWFGYKSGLWLLIAPVPVHCVSFTFSQRGSFLVRLLAPKLNQSIITETLKSFYTL